MQSRKKRKEIATQMPEMHGEDRAGELDITHYELTQSDAPRHELNHEV